jgi:hypothetical protein
MQMRPIFRSPIAKTGTAGHEHLYLSVGFKTFDVAEFTPVADVPKSANIFFDSSHCNSRHVCSVFTKACEGK